MNRDWTDHKIHAVLAVSLVLILAAMLAGCGGNKDVETDPEMTEPAAPAETVPAEPTPEVPAEPEPEVTTPNYEELDPSEYGIEAVFFAFDEYDLDDIAMGILSRNARILRETEVTLVISGHADERGTVEYNLALGERRAVAVRDYLVSLGVPSRKLRVTSYGESRPFAMGSTEEAWAQNRRAHFERP